MAVIVSLPLFGNPGQELEEGSPAKARQLRDLATELRDRLEKAAQLVEQLETSGWTARVAVHDLVFAHAQVQTEDEARRRFQELGLDPEQFVIFEEVLDDD